MTKIRKFLLSPFYSLLLLLMTLVSIITGNEVVGAIIMAITGSLCFMLCENIMPFIQTALVMICFVIRCKYSFNDFWHYKILAIPVLIFLCSRFFIYPVKLKKGSCFWGIFLSSIAVTSGGVGYLIPKQYFSETSVFYIATLGFGQLLFYCFFLGEFQKDCYKNLDEDIFRAVVPVIPTLFICVLQEYISRWSEFTAKMSVIPFQWRNNSATILMLAMPFAFYLIKKHWSFALFAIMDYITIILSGSRGGLLFGSLELVILTVILYKNEKKLRKFIIIFCIFAVLLVIAERKAFLSLISYTIQRLFSTEENSIRLELIPRCIADFKANPLFGKGLIYMGNRDVHKSAKFTLCWYHNSVAQVVGSMGIMGIAGYSFLNFKRVKCFIKSKCPVKTALFLSFISLEMMSLVNPGIFAPFPYLTMVTLFFALMDRGGDALSNQKLPLVP